MCTFTKAKLALTKQQKHEFNIASPGDLIIICLNCKTPALPNHDEPNVIQFDDNRLLLLGVPLAIIMYDVG